MKNFTPYSTQHLINFFRKSEILLFYGREDFLKNLKKDPYIAKQIDLIQWEVKKLYGKKPYKIKDTENARIILYIQSLVVLYIAYPSPYVFKEDILSLFSMIDSMYLDFEKTGKFLI